MAAFRTVWTALVGIYDETLVLVGGNVAALALNLPILAVIRVATLPAVGVDDEANFYWNIALAGLTLFLPTPGNVALAGVTRVAAGPDVPQFGEFARNLKARWWLALRCSVISLSVLALLAWNVVFYVNVETPWVRFVSFLWLYATLFWLSLHIYLSPLLVHVAEPRLLDVYRRAAFVALGHPGYSLLLLLLLLALSFASVVFLPVYVLAAGAFINLAQAHALREIRRRHGDLVVDADEEVGRL